MLELEEKMMLVEKENLELKKDAINVVIFLKGD